MANKFLDSNGLLYLWSKIKSAFVAKEAGKGLSANDYTTTEKTKLAGIDTGANHYTLPQATTTTLGGVKVGTGLAITTDGVLNSTYGGKADSVEWSGVLNKPTTVAGYGLTDVASGAEPNVQADWNVTDDDSDAFIKNKPTAMTPTAHTHVKIEVGLGNVDNTSDLGKPVSTATQAVLDTKVDQISGKSLSTNDYTTTEKTKLAGIATGADISPITSIKRNGVAVSITGKSVDLSVPVKVSELTNDSGYLTTHQDISGKADKATTLSGYGITDAYSKDQIDGRLTSTYKAGGSKAFASLPDPSASTLGYVYNITSAFTTTSSFVEGAGKSYPVGTNVAVVITTDGTYMYDVFAGFVDLSGYVQTTDLTAVTNTEIDTIVAS